MGRAAEAFPTRIPGLVLDFAPRRLLAPRRWWTGLDATGIRAWIAVPGKARILAEAGVD